MLKHTITRTVDNRKQKILETVSGDEAVKYINQLREEATIKQNNAEYSLEVDNFDEKSLKIEAQF